MKIETYRSMGLNVPISVPSTIEENEQLAAPRVNATLEDAVDTNVYRGTLADFRDGFCAAVETATSIKRNTEVAKNAKGEVRKDEDGAEIEVYKETEQDYFRRVCIKTSRSVESFQDIANSVAASLKYDPSVKERTPAGPKTPPKSVFAIVDDLHAKHKHTHVAADLSKVLGRHVESDRESLARAIHEDNLNERRKQLAKYASA